MNNSVGSKGGEGSPPVYICTACARSLGWSPYHYEMWHNHGVCEYCGCDASITNIKDWNKYNTYTQQLPEICTYVAFANAVSVSCPLPAVVAHESRNIVALPDAIRAFTCPVKVKEDADTTKIVVLDGT